MRPYLSHTILQAIVYLVQDFMRLLKSLATGDYNNYTAFCNSLRFLKGLLMLLTFLSA
jgi:hypothetical protein